MIALNILAVAIGRVGEGEIAQDLVVALDPSLDGGATGVEILSVDRDVEGRDLTDVEAVPEAVAVDVGRALLLE